MLSRINENKIAIIAGIALIAIGANLDWVFSHKLISALVVSNAFNALYHKAKVNDSIASANRKIQKANNASVNAGWLLYFTLMAFKVKFPTEKDSPMTVAKKINKVNQDFAKIEKFILAQSVIPKVDESGQPVKFSLNEKEFNKLFQELCRDYKEDYTPPDEKEESAA